LVGQPLRISIDFLSGGFAGKGEERLSAYPQYEKVAEALPPGAVLLRHEMQMHLGFGVPTVSDWFQTGISWGTKKTMTDMHRTLRHHGVTHVVWASGNSKAFDSYAADINFF